MEEELNSWNPFKWQPATLYFRTQDEAYSYGERPSSGWNPIVGAPLRSVALVSQGCDRCQFSAG